MKEDEDRREHQLDLALCGTVAADVSHEMRNVLSIIGQYAGLLDDLVQLAERGKPVDYAKLRGLAANIGRQVGKGTETMERFSRFAHAADEPTTSFDLVGLVENTAALAGRRVALAGCRLEVELPDGPLPVRGDAFALQSAVFSSIRGVVESQSGGEAVRVKLAPEGPTAVLRVWGASDGELAKAVLERLSAAVGRWKGSFETDSADGVLSVTIAVPT